jgi:hypothetical protein
MSRASASALMRLMRRHGERVTVQTPAPNGYETVGLNDLRLATLDRAYKESRSPDPFLLVLYRGCGKDYILMHRRQSISGIAFPLICCFVHGNSAEGHGGFGTNAEGSSIKSGAARSVDLGPAESTSVIQSVAKLPCPFDGVPTQMPHAT